MTRRVNYARRAARSGRGLIPPNPSQWDCEHNGLDLRDDLGIPIADPLAPADAFELLPGVTVLPHGDIPAAAVHIESLRDNGGRAWSGMAITLPDGHELIVYNDAHPLTRVRATLMEEFYHLLLEHKRSQVRLYGAEGQFRSYDAVAEREAYGSGAAALVPYKPLREMVSSGATPDQVARHFTVSRDLVLYRCKVTRSYGKLRRH